MNYHYSNIIIVPLLLISTIILTMVITMAIIINYDSLWLF